jgi:DNA repair exonuclease SbcCD ATPase subunit
MWNPVKISFKNLYSHVNSQYEFKTNLCTVIYGQNKDGINIDNNGSGKSTLFEAIDIALTGKSSRGVDKESFINNEAKECVIDFTLENKFLKTEMRIVRKFFRGSKSSQIEVWENGKQNTQLVNVNNANKYVFEQIGINEQDLGRYYIISQDNRFTFFTANDADKKEILNRITNADVLNPLIEDLKNKIKDKVGILRNLERKCSETEGKISFIEGQIRSVDENNTYDEQINILKDKINEAKKDNSETNEEIKELSFKIKEATVLVKKTEPKSNSQELKNTIREKTKELREFNALINQIELELAGEIECPECKAHFINGGKIDITLDELYEYKDSVKDSIKILEKEIKDAEFKLNEVEKLVLIYEDAVSNLEDLKRSERRLKQEIEDINNNIERWSIKIEILKKEKNNDTQRVTLLSNKISLEKELKSVNKELNDITNNLEILRFWEYHLGRTGMQTYLANKSVKTIEGLTNSFLKKFGVDMSCLINGFTVLKDGTIRDKIETFVNTDGINQQSFMAKSGGERARVQLAGILALQQLINMSCKERGMNFLALDESFAGIDSSGFREIIKIISTLGITVMLITQNIEDVSSFPNTLKVIKENGVSCFVN